MARKLSRLLIFMAAIAAIFAFGVGTANAQQPATEKDLTAMQAIGMADGLMKTCGIRGFNRERVFANYLAQRRNSGASEGELQSAAAFWRNYMASADRGNRRGPRIPCDADMRRLALEARAQLESGVIPK